MTAAAEPAVLPDAGTCRWCPHGQWSHKRGKGGCRELDCICDRYGPPKDAPVPGVIENRPDDADPAVCVGGFEPAQPGDVDLPVVADPAAQAAYVDQVAAIDAQPAESEPTDDEIADEIDRAEAAADVERLTVQLEQAYERVDELTAERDQAAGAAEDAQRRAERLAGELDAAQAAVVRLSADLGRANADRQRARAAVDDAIRTGAAAGARVIRRYDAEQCGTCGYRTTVPIDHEHPLEPVTVLIVRREVAR